MLVLVAGTGCGQTPGPGADQDSALPYRVALEEMRRESGEDTMRVHPRLILPPSAGDGGLIRFSRYADTTAVARATAGDAHFKLCHPKPSGACDVPPTSSYVVLAEAIEDGPNKLSIPVLVSHGADRGYSETRYQVDLKRTSGNAEWKMIAARRTK